MIKHANARAWVTWHQKFEFDIMHFATCARSLTLSLVGADTRRARARSAPGPRSSTGGAQLVEPHEREGADLARAARVWSKV